MGEASLNNSNSSTAHLSAIHSAPLSCGDTAWYALKVRTGAEPTVVATLEARDVISYCPTHKVRRRYTDRIKVVDAPLFPGYIFCQFDARQKGTVISSPGVEYIVGFANGPVPIAEYELMNIRRIIGAGASATRSLVSGQRVRVTHGPLEGVEGQLVREETGFRLIVSIELLNQGACLHIDQDDVCLVG